MVKVSKGTSEQSNYSDLKSNQKRLKTSIDSSDKWSDSIIDTSRMSKERPVSHVSDEGI